MKRAARVALTVAAIVSMMAVIVSVGADGNGSMDPTHRTGAANGGTSGNGDGSGESGSGCSR